MVSPTVPAKAPLPKKKKRRISKHVLKSQRNRQQQVLDVDSRGLPPTSREDAAAAEPEAAATSHVNVSSRKKSSLVVKDPSEALMYLTRWKETQQPTQPVGKSGKMPEAKSTNGSPDGWKFNKNTQSWLIRHMYEAKYVSKNTFILLLEYLQSLQGKSRVRVRDDALRRAHRYQRHHKANAQPIDHPMGSQHMDADTLLEQTRWDQLNEHDKRKEYKRARKILEELQE